MKRNIFLLLFALTMGISASAQQDSDANDRRKSQTERFERRATRMADNLKLDDKTQAWFVPLYAEYQQELSEANRIGRPAPQAPAATDRQADKKDGKDKKDKKSKKADKSRQMKQMTDAEALSFIEGGFDRAEKRVAIQRSYFAKMKSKLTPQQLLTVFGRQAEGPQMGDGQRRPQQTGDRRMDGRGGNFGGPGSGDGFGGGFGGGDF